MIGGAQRRGETFGIVTIDGVGIPRSRQVVPDLGVARREPADALQPAHAFAERAEQRACNAGCVQRCNRSRSLALREDLSGHPFELTFI